MTSFKKYLLHRIKATWVLTLVLCLFAVIITATTVQVRHYSYYDVKFDEQGNPTKEEVLIEDVQLDSLSIIFVALCGLCTVIPVIELGELKNKRNADVTYSLPVDRRKMCVAHFANGFIQILAVYACAAITAAMIIVSNGKGHLYLQYLPPLLLLPIPAALFLYAYFSYLFNEANSVVDGCVSIASGILMPFMLFLSLSTFDLYINGKFVITVVDRLQTRAFPYFPITKIVGIFSDALTHRNLSFSYDELDIAMIVVWCIIGILAAIGFYFSFSRKRVETIGDISSSWVSYKSIIPLAMFCITVAIDHSGDFFIVIIGAIAAIIGYMLYRRSFKIKMIDIISIGGAVALAIVLRIIESALRHIGGR